MPLRSRKEGARLFIGHTRFSVHSYGSTQFNATREASRGAGFTEKEYTAWLYDEKRLAPRTEILTRFSLPQLARAAEDVDLVHFLSYSPSLPERHKHRLYEAAEEYEFLKLNETTGPVGTFPADRLLNRVLQEYDPSNSVYGVYRLDDDDVLSVNYFDQMTPYVIPEHHGWWVSLGTGISAIKDGGHHVLAREHYYPKSAFGLLYVGGVTGRGRPARIKAPKHTVVDKHAPTILDSREAAYFHIRHKGQDSSLGSEEGPFYAEAMSRVLKGNTADLRLVKDNFPVLYDTVVTSPGQDQNRTELSGPTDIGKTKISFPWGREGTLLLQLNLANVVLKSQEVRVRIIVEAEDGRSPDSPEILRFFAQAKIYWSPEYHDYWTWVPRLSSGGEYILPLEPPSGVKVIKLSLVAEKNRVVPTSGISAFQLELV